MSPFIIHDFIHLSSSPFQSMKAGRQSYIPAKWIIVSLPEELMYFELDKKGNLVGKITQPHHVTSRTPVDTPTSIAPMTLIPRARPNPEVQVQVPVEVQAAQRWFSVTSRGNQV
jgi:hypothetical protein